MVKFPALRERSEGDSRNRVAVDGGAAWQPVAGGGALEERRTFVLSHPSRKRRGLDGAQSIGGEPEVKTLTGPPANS